jgi:predicted transcriptional regulator
MRIKKALLVVEPGKDFLDRAFSALSRPPKKATNVIVISFPSFEALGRVVTGARLELLRAIRLKKPGSIQELARIVKRDVKNVYQDVKLLSEIGLINLKSAGPRKAAVPQSKFTEIIFAA